MKVFSLLWLYDDFFIALFLQSFRRKQLHWVVRSCKPVPIRLHVHLFTVAHLHSEHFRPNFTYTIQFLYPSTSFSCTFACSVSTQPKFMRLLLKPVLFCSHASNSTAWTAIAAGATSPNDAIPAATSSCPMNVAPWCSGIEVALSNVGHISSISPPSLSSQSTHISDFAAPTRRFNSWRTLLVAVTKPLKYPSESVQGINMPFGQPKFALNCTNNKYP